jgi:acyl carrier protein
MPAEEARIETIQDVVESLLGSPLQSASGLLDAGVLDSLLTMKLITALEEEFSIRFETSDFSYFNFNSIQAMADLVDRYVDLS